MRTSEGCLVALQRGESGDSKYLFLAKKGQLWLKAQSVTLDNSLVYLIVFAVLWCCVLITLFTLVMFVDTGIIAVMINIVYIGLPCNTDIVMNESCYDHHKVLILYYLDMEYTCLRGAGQMRKPLCTCE